MTVGLTFQTASIAACWLAIGILERKRSVPAFEGRSEFLLEGTDFEFHSPRARILVREMPEGLCDCVGLEKVCVLQARF